VLTKTPNGEGETAEAGAPNLYMFERDREYPAGRTTFVARLSSQDLEKWIRGVTLSTDGPTGGAPVDVTPDGRFLVFTSNRDLTPDDTSTASGEPNAWRLTAKGQEVQRAIRGQTERRGRHGDGKTAGR
jgi:Tol biopolymer transport system component